MNEIIRNIMLVILFCSSLALLFFGQKNVGYQGLAMEIIGLLGLLFDLYMYNRKYK